MPNTNLNLIQLLRAAGFDLEKEPPGEEIVREVHDFNRLVSEDPREALLRWLQLRKRTTHAEAACARAAEAAEKLESILLRLKKNAVLYHVEDLDLSDGSDPRVLSRVSGELRHLSIHPEVKLEDLERLRPWEYVRVARAGSDELLVVGTYSHPGLRSHCQGLVVEFRGYHDREHGLVRVARHGDDEEVIRLSPELWDVPLAPPMKLVLMRDDPRWAIATADVNRPQSRFEVPIERIRTRLGDLAGLDPILEPLVKDIVLRVVRTDLQKDFDLEPLNGVLIYSYQPGTGKTSLVRGLARWLGELGEERGFDVVLHVVPPNALKNKYHGEDARIVREDLCGSLRARQAESRTRPLFQLVVLDEIDSLGRRVGGDDLTGYHSPAQNDAVQALLAEMDGMIQAESSAENPPAHVLWMGLTNRPDMVDEALKRPGRFDLILAVPPATLEGAEGILAVYARADHLPWSIDDEIKKGVEEEEIRRRFLRPALHLVFDRVVLRYSTDGRREIDVRAGEILTGACYKHAVNKAKHKAATRQLLGCGIPAITFEDLVDGLLEEATSQARNMEADRQMLTRQLRLKVPVTRVELVPAEELASHRFLRLQSA